MAQRFDKAQEYTQKYKHMLLPCRYCGSTDIHIVSDRTIFSPKNVWSVCCSTHACDCTSSYTSVQHAIHQWNQRHQHSVDNANVPV